MERLKTHVQVVQTDKDNKELGFDLSPISPRSANFVVREMPLSLLVWGLASGEWVEVRRARVGSLGSRVWQLDDGCCSGAIIPDDVVNIRHMPYLRCGKPVKIYSDNPQVIIDDVGIFYLVYHGSNDVSIDLMPDAVVRKCCCGETQNDERQEIELIDKPQECGSCE